MVSCVVLPFSVYSVHVLLQLDLEIHEVFEMQHLYSGNLMHRNATFADMMASYYGAGESLR